MPKAKRKRAAVPITRDDNVVRVSSRDRGAALIRKFHTVQTALTSAINSGDSAEQTRLEDEIEALGGLKTYQKASIRGQDKRRGGDSSKVLIDWLKEPELDFQWPAGKSRVLEIGSLSTENYISKYPRLDVSRIDLNSQDPAIQQQDFLTRPVPETTLEEFEGISCSLVLNFVPIANRSDFLLHLTKFLPISSSTITRWLFFVLPAPCINNSRYTNKTTLMRVFETLGFEKVREKVTDRIAYWLFKRTKDVTPGQTFKKAELQAGKSRNNFFIPLRT